MITMSTILLFAALFSFIVAVVLSLMATQPEPARRINFVAIGLACATLAFLLPRIAA